MPTFNADLPEGLVHKGMPAEAIVGHLNDDTTVEAFTDSMASAGIDATRIHILTGEEGAAVLNNMGTRLSRIFGPDRDKPVELLKHGADPRRSIRCTRRRTSRNRDSPA